MWLLTSRIGRAIAGAGALLLGLLTFGEYQRRKERQEIENEMNEAYNNTTKEVRDAQVNLPDDPDAVLDGLHKFTKRGKRGSDT
jgi:hypothetical protein